jgi:hypothetical protein
MRGVLIYGLSDFKHIAITLSNLKNSVENIWGQQPGGDESKEPKMNISGESEKAC